MVSNGQLLIWIKVYIVIVRHGKKWPWSVQFNCISGHQVWVVASEDRMDQAEPHEQYLHTTYIYIYTEIMFLVSRKHDGSTI